LLTLYVEYGINALIWLVVVVAAVDVGAFFIGKRFGKTPFSPTSPNKTLEGVFGGIIFGTVLGFFMGTAIVEPLLAFIISFAMAGSAIFGDLYESFLKREAGVKDSGDIFPGHGGMLDRVDGYLFAVIVMVVLLRGLV
jgi:phosphatidate cytidylyltransferase